MGRALRTIPIVLALAYAVAGLSSVRADEQPIKTVCAVLLFTAAIAVSRSLPWVSLVLVVGVPLLQVSGILELPNDRNWPFFLASIVVSFFVGLRPSGLGRYLGLIIGVAIAALDAYCIASSGSLGEWTAVGGGSISSHPLWTEFATITLAAFGLYAGSWAAGVVLTLFRLGRNLEVAQQQLATKDLELRLSEDRQRIARDVHDALAHSLAVVVAQADGAAAMREQDPHVALESLESISTVSRTALLDVRRLVEQIRDDDDFVSMRGTIDNVPDLVEHIASSGIAAVLNECGVPVPLGASQGITVYRLVQESLTNALKHAGPGSTVDVQLAWSAEGLHLEVISRGGRPLISPGSDGPGVGIQGMKERARLAGGWIVVTPSDNAFVVSGFIPRSAAPTYDPAADWNELPPETGNIWGTTP